jgi:uncharacterized protein (TIGR02646 family)
MIRVRRAPVTQALTADQRQRLAAKQTEANGYAAQDARITQAWDNFRRTKAGKAVYAALKAAFRSKCAFCERVNARTADHFYPKERYPRRMFRWANFLLCCAECNFAKGTFFEFANRRPVLIDPSRDDPADHFTWDFATGAMVPSVDPVRQRRAVATRDQLKLDEGPLRDERRVQLRRILYLLARVSEEHPAIRADTRERLAEELHPDRPYLAIIRFLFREPNGYRPLVDDARAKLPDIDTWTAGWL